MRRILLTVFFIGFAATVLAADNEVVLRKDFKNYVEAIGIPKAKAKLNDGIAKLEISLKAAKNAQVDQRRKEKFEKVVSGRLVMTFVSKEQKAETVKKLEDAIEAAKQKLESNPWVPPLLSPGSPKIGQIGRLYQYAPYHEEHESHSTFEVVQVVDGSNCLITFGRAIDGNRAWLTTPTAGMVDGKSYSFQNDIFECVGTKQYSTVIGAPKTVHHLKQVKIEDLLKN